MPAKKTTRRRREPTTAASAAIPPYRIENHRLIKSDGTPVDFLESPNHGGALTSEYLIMHFTAGRDAVTSIRWFRNPDAKASAHLVIARDGQITQMVPFNVVAWHAGKSQWAGKEGLNGSSIGIELDNAGKLEETEGGWKAWFGMKVPSDQVLRATHKDEARPAGWHIFTEPQLAVAVEVAAAIVRHYNLRDVLGHDDIAPIRKKDPGPAFPMSSFRGRVMGREDGTVEIYETTANVNLRVAPSSSAAKVLAEGLPAKTRVSSLGQSQGAWWKVEVLDVIQGDGDLEGWLHSSFLRLKPRAR